MNTMTVEDETDLITLTGENEEYKNLVEEFFTWNLTWGDIKGVSRNEFLDSFCKDQAIAVRYHLLAWVKDYNLMDRFQPEAQQENGELCYLFSYSWLHITDCIPFVFCILVFE